jgi:hypothetical protein
MAAGQEATDTKDKTLVLKVAKGSSLDERFTEWINENDVSGAAGLLMAVEAMLASAGYPAPPPVEAKK